MAHERGVDAASVQRIALLLMLYGGFHQVSYWIEPTAQGVSYRYGGLIMIVALLVGAAGVAMESLASA